MEVDGVVLPLVGYLDVLVYEGDHLLVVEAEGVVLPLVGYSLMYLFMRATTS